MIASWMGGQIFMVSVTEIRKETVICWINTVDWKEKIIPKLKYDHYTVRQDILIIHSNLIIVQ